MNTIRRPRRRPRGRSVNFRTLWWLVTREAALRVLMISEIDPRGRPWRSWLLTARSYIVIRAAHAALDRFPERRYCR